MRAKRRNLVEQARAILDAVPAGETLSGEDEARFDALMEKADNYDAIIDDEVGRVAGAGRDTMFTFRTAEGREIPGLLAEHRFQDLPGVRSWADDAPPGSVFGERLSLGRFVIAAATGDWSHAEAEAEAMRAMTSTPDSAGGFLIPAQLSALLIDEARSASVLIPAGAITVPMETQSLDIARVTGSPSAEFRAVGDELINLPSTGATLGRISLRAKTLGAVVDISEELAQDTSGAGAEGLIEALLIEAVGGQLDRAFLRGQIDSDDDTAAERLKGGQSGVLDDSEIQEITAVGSPHWDDFVDAVTKVAEQNGTARSMLITPRDNGTLEKLKDATSGLYLRPPDAVADLRRFQTNQLPNVSGTTEALVGNLTSGFVILGVRNQFRIEVSRVAGDSFEKYGVKVRIVGRYDIAVGRPKHLVALRGLTA